MANELKIKRLTSGVYISEADKLAFTQLLVKSCWLATLPRLMSV